MFDILIFDILVLSGAATIVVTVSSYLKLPTIVGFLFAGLIVGPKGLALVNNLPDAYSLTELAGIVLMFTIGLEFSIAKLKDLQRQFLRLGLPQVLLTIALVIGLGYLLTSIGGPRLIVWGFLISLSSTALVLKLLHDYRDFAAPHGQNSLGVLLFQDIAVIPMMLIMPLLVASHEPANIDWQESLLWFGKLLGSVIFLWSVHKFALPFILERVLKTRSHELFFFTIIFACLGIAYLFHVIGLSMSLGAFVAGVIISESAFAHHTMSIFGSVRDTLLGIFFAAIGMLLDISFIGSHIVTVLAIGFCLFLLKFSLVFFLCRINRIPNATSIQTALTICQVGEFSFLLASRGVELGILSEIDNQYFLSISVLSMIGTPFLYLLAPKIAHFRPSLQWRSLAMHPEKEKLIEQINAASEVQRQPVKENTVEKPRGHTIVIGYGIAGKNIVESLRFLELPFQIVEMNYELVKKQRQLGLYTTFGDATKHEVLRHAGLETAKMVVIAVSSSQAIPHIIKAIRSVRSEIPILVRVHFVQDMKSIDLDPHMEAVVSEIETATELTAKVLKNYGVDASTIFDFTVRAKQDLTTVASLSSRQRYQIMSLPSWDALASIRPFVIESTHWACGKKLSELSIPKLAGISVVSVYRHGVGTTVPDGDYRLEAKDVMHLIGPPERFGELERLLVG